VSRCLLSRGAGSRTDALTVLKSLHVYERLKSLRLVENSLSAYVVLYNSNYIGLYALPRYEVARVPMDDDCKHVKMCKPRCNTDIRKYFFSQIESLTDGTVWTRTLLMHPV